MQFKSHNAIRDHEHTQVCVLANKFIIVVVVRREGVKDMTENL
jgi:hypothetical protein